MTTPKRLLSTAILFVIALLAGACAPMPGSSVTNAATIVYTSGASQYTAALGSLPLIDFIKAEIIS